MHLNFPIFALALTLTFTVASSTAYSSTKNQLLPVTDDLIRPITRSTQPLTINLNEIAIPIQQGVATAPNQLSNAVTETALNILRQDYIGNMKDLVRYRWFFRKIANTAECFGNGLLYVGSGLAAISAAVKLVGSQEASDILLFASTGCFAGHLTLMGIAKCSAREEGEREAELKEHAATVGFSVISLIPMITDEQATTTQPIRQAQ